MDVRAPRPQPRHAAIFARHLANFGPLAVIATAAFCLALARLPDGASLPARVAYALLVALNVLVLAMSSWCNGLGLIVVLSRRRVMDVAGLKMRPPSGAARVAILFAIHEEDAAQVFAAARVIADDVAGAGIGTSDVFVLSDSRTPGAIAIEEAMLDRASRTGGPRLLYRRRNDNSGRKAGNVAEFVTRWGAAYDFMVVLDADSLMTGACIARLVGAMEANPRAGLIQAMCYPVGRQTTFARLQQFDSRLIGPLFQAGTAFWQGPRGNFWGHNAIIRCAAFAASCGLPKLPGKSPFGGEIMSHDTVEAALMLRCDHEVWMLPSGPDGRPDCSWEETPTNLVDHLKRDRRWLRGNLQHVGVLAASGLKTASLYHLLRGLAHFLYAPLLALWLLAYALLDRSIRLDGLVVLVAVLLALPRGLGLIAALAGGDAAGYGGSARLIASAAASQLFATLIYPVVAVSHLIDLVAMMFAGASRWAVQSRDDRNLSRHESFRALMPAAIVLSLAALALANATPVVAAWLAVGAAAAIPLALETSRSRRWPLFATPEETTPHPLRLRRQHIEAQLRAGRKIEPDAASAPLPPPRGLDMPTQSLSLHGNRSAVGMTVG
ncbi:Glucosyltransferase [Beijerinckiaceae bacterium RH AL1]|nr:glucans biosynthesis glucosyltransferase MdoH [Beijerinckiaceae bacterium]VVB49122.1 Glucosyltransferase [Beijerinckiaceae bacterium RH CH11]VVB49201.1 Glucosyltransferase [Beijerinckiaceae bacterium RH AL8]VVC56738.1 Glucosyltransferase [Beijerinckiaceae bacterium RH AL1]